jgi:hypothetical protein
MADILRRRNRQTIVSMTPPLAIRLLIKWHARYFVRAMYLALLERDADRDGFAAYCKELRRNGDLVGVTRSIAKSEEARDRVLFGKPAQLVTAAFRGLLGRDPEQEALTAYSENLANVSAFANTLDEIGRSDEHFRRLIAIHAEHLVRAAFLALLKREPEPEALAIYMTQLRQTSDITMLMAAIAGSPEHTDSLLAARRQSETLLSSDDLPALLGEVVASPRAWNELAALHFPRPAPAHDALDQDAWVFIHIQKTGGTSLQNMLADTYGDQNVYREHADTLYRRPPAELAQYAVFAGHFDFDSVTYIPRRTRRLFTFLREPRQRLLSHYRFLRSHEPHSPHFKGRMEIANRLDEAAFFRSVMALAGNDLWNHLTWCVMGQRKWNAYRQLLSGLEDQTLESHLGDIRAEIRGRLREFAFIGLQEDFLKSCQRLFGLLGSHLPHIRHDHSVEALSADARYFKFVPRQPLTETISHALAPLVQLDDIVFEEGSALYRQRWGGDFDARQ